MILESIMSVLKNVLGLLLVFKIPPMPEQALNYVNSFFDYMASGAGILANYTPLGYLLVLLGVLLAVDAGIMVYHFVMWIIRKIPMVSMS